MCKYLSFIFADYATCTWTCGIDPPPTQICFLHMFRLLRKVTQCCILHATCMNVAIPVYRCTLYSVFSLSPSGVNRMVALTRLPMARPNRMTKM